MKLLATILAFVFLIACQATDRADNDGDTLSSVKRDVDTVVGRFTDKVDSVTQTILDSAKAKGPRLIRKGEKAVKEVFDKDSN